VLHLFHGQNGGPVRESVGDDLLKERSEIVVTVTSNPAGVCGVGYGQAASELVQDLSG
jgi:hypothetical protein